MSSKNNKKKGMQNSRAAKKAAVLGVKKRSRLPLILMLILAVAGSGGAFYYYKEVSSKTSSKALEKMETKRSDPKEVSFPITLFEDGKARHFTHQEGSINIKYFIVKSSDGTVRAAFDACDVCWPAGKGYFQEGNHMICRNCGRKFESARINEVKGGCNPAPLRRTVRGGDLVIQIKDIMEGKQYFNLS